MARLRNLLRTKPEASPASKPARAVIGLRNPGSDYEGTRHNSGYEVLARVLVRAGEKLGRGPSRVQAQVTQIGAGDDRLLYAVPMTYMNESGRAVRNCSTTSICLPRTSWSSTTTSTSPSGASGFRSGVEAVATTGFDPSRPHSERRTSTVSSSALADRPGRWTRPISSFARSTRRSEPRSSS